VLCSAGYQVVDVADKDAASQVEFTLEQDLDSDGRIYLRRTFSFPGKMNGHMHRTTDYER
jgi:hypothetical protein